MDLLGEPLPAAYIKEAPGSLQWWHWLNDHIWHDATHHLSQLTNLGQQGARDINSDFKCITIPGICVSDSNDTQKMVWHNNNEDLWFRFFNPHQFLRAVITNQKNASYAIYVPLQSHL